MTVDLYPKQVAAYKIVQRAKERGELIPGNCARVSAECHGRIEGHHENYDEPLAVVWLCARHHRQLHEARRAAA